MAERQRPRAFPDQTCLGVATRFNPVCLTGGDVKRCFPHRLLQPTVDVELGKIGKA